MAIQEILDGSPASFKDNILTNLWVTCKHSASNFDNEHRDETLDIAEELGTSYSLLHAAFKAFEHDDSRKHLWFAVWPTWQSANALLGAYQSIRMGFPHEAFVILRYVLESHALAASLLLHPEKLGDYLEGKFTGQRRIGDLKTLYPAMGMQYGVITETVAHPSGVTAGNFIYDVGPDAITFLIGGGLPEGSSGHVRGDMARMAVSVCGLNSSYLNATSELIAMSLVKDPTYWRRGTSGPIWRPEGKARTRHDRRTDEFIKFWDECQSRYSHGSSPGD
jgi:hypothetical protein